jgi:Carboxypeptidase regulatory-like domain
MKRRSSLCLAVIFLLAIAASAQDRGRITITVQTKADASGVIGQANGAKIMVVHWTNSQMHPAMVQDQVATTDKMGTCTLDLLPGVYDLFVSASGLSPYAVKVDVVAGENAPLTITLKAGSMHLRPVN